MTKDILWQALNINGSLVIQTLVAGSSPPLGGADNQEESSNTIRFASQSEDKR